MQCIEKGCTGNIGPKKVNLQTGCHSATACPYCDTCGAIHYPDGTRMYQRGYNNKPFFINGEIIHKPTEEEEARPMKVQDMIGLYNSAEHQEEWRKQLLPEILEYFEKISKLDHTSDCALGAVPACTCGLSEARDFLKKHKKQGFYGKSKTSWCGRYEKENIPRNRA